ncbi:tetratricopeptide repeat protein [Hyalangium minutum]|uniref:Tetratricopeptide repeat protein n=1 Tax=Hyalangium minutum TaxID=394096 RepID=A0A085WJ03_9BACT|nr:tetratricopeptide repeat protein [Hyalangium minutum]KFE67666.1 hypothetical protein DB31_8149 [Hyalangium minutum]
MDPASAKADGPVSGKVEQHLQVASGLLRERQAPKAFGELVRASRSLPMTRRLAAALVAVSLRAGTEAAAITILSSAVGKAEGTVRRDVYRQLARVLRRVEQFPRAIEALESLLASFPGDHGSRRVLQHLLERTGKWEALVASLETEAQEAFVRAEYARAARAASWRARIQAEQMRNLARAAESYGKAANYLEQMGDAGGAFAVRLDGLRVMHGAGASEAVLTAAASVCMSAAARLGRDAQARQVLEELKLIPVQPKPPPTETSPGFELATAALDVDVRKVDVFPPELESWLARPVKQIAETLSRPVAETQPAPPRAPAPKPAGPSEEADVPRPPEPPLRASPSASRTARPAATVEMSLPLLQAMIAASASGKGVGAPPSPVQAAPAVAPAQPPAPSAPAPVEAAVPSPEASSTVESAAPSAPLGEAAALPGAEPVNPVDAHAEVVAASGPEPVSPVEGETGSAAAPSLEPVSSIEGETESAAAPSPEPVSPIEGEDAAVAAPSLEPVSPVESEAEAVAAPSSEPASSGDDQAGAVAALAAEPTSPAGAEAQAVEAPSAESVRAAEPESESVEVPSAEPSISAEAPAEPAAPSAEQVEAAAVPSSEVASSPAPEIEAAEAAAAASGPAQAEPPSAEAEDVEAFAAPQEEGAAPSMSELLEIPDEGSSHRAPPVASQDGEESGEDSEEPDTSAQEPWEDPEAEHRLEASLIARKSWRELAQFYLSRADAAKDPMLRAEALTRLAELMEDELGDPSGAARIYREIVTLTGDRDALKEQVRLLGQRGDSQLVRRALDEAVQTARTPKARAAAYLTRAERSLEAGDPAKAKADFETAEALTPGMLLVLAGLVRCVSNAERPLLAQRLRSALAAAPRRSPDRLDALRVLASVAEDLLKDAKLAQWAWTEVLAEDPSETRAHERLLELARALKDGAALSQLLREQISRDPRGPAARQARMELVAALEAAGDMNGALTELRQAVRFEPGHKEAWLMLADRLTECGQIGEAAWAMEHAASAMEDEAERQRAWVRLASFCHKVLKDPTRAEMYSRRAENLRLALQEKAAPPVTDAPRGPAPYREGGTRTQVLMPPPGNVDLTPSGQRFPPLDDDRGTDVTDPAPNLPDHARPTIEFSAVNFPGDAMPFSDEETTATEAPEGFVPPGDAPPAAPPEKAAKSEKAPKSEKGSKPEKSPQSEKGSKPEKAAAVPKNLGKKLKIEALDPSRELDSLLGEELDDTGHTSPSLSAWNIKRPVLVPATPQKESAPAQPPAASGQKQKPPPEKPAAAEPTDRPKKLRPQVTEEMPRHFTPDPESPTRAAAAREVTAPGRRGGAKPPPAPESPAARSTAPTPNATGSRPAAVASPQAPSASGAQRGAQRRTSAEDALAQVSPQESEGPPSLGSGPVQNTAFISWEAPPGKMEPVRRMARARSGAPTKAPLPEHGSEPAVFKQVREHPLDGELYAEIAQYFDSRGDAQRAELMREISDALVGREGAAARPPRRPLSPEDRSGLRHPILRSPSGELLTCVGVALCRLFPTHGRAAGTTERLRPNQGLGASAALEALQTTERLLGIEAPAVLLSEDNGPPFSLVFTTEPRLLVGKQAVRQVLPAPELRFYAGRALLCLGPDLLALRSLKKDQVLRGLALFSSVMKDPRADGLEARVVRETLTPKQLERAMALYGPATRQFDVSALADGARDSSNRAGLIACGAVGPALAALRMKRALEREVVELVRFAASERYFQLRSQR